MRIKNGNLVGWLMAGALAIAGCSAEPVDTKAEDDTFEAYDLDFPTFEMRLLAVNNPAPALGTVTTGGINCGTTCSTIYGKGSTVTLKATPAPDKRLVAWTGCDTHTATTCTVKLVNNRTVGVVWGDCATGDDATECMNSCQDACLEDGYPPLFCWKDCADQCDICL
jgi:hypothetical protein